MKEISNLLLYSITSGLKLTIASTSLGYLIKSSYVYLFFLCNGFLVGVAVGVGFGVFETAGYILNYGMKNGIETMLQVIKFHGLLAPDMHVAWATIEGGALMYVKGFDKLSKKHLNDKRFLLICIIPLVLHWFWDLPIQAPFELLG